MVNMESEWQKKFVDKKKIAIMQPTYLSWLGYFALMSHVDCFVYLDDVQFAKRSWQQRNQIKTPNGSMWLTVPVITKGKRDQLLKEVMIDQNSDFRTSHMKSIKQYYARSRYFEYFFPSIERVYSGCQSNSLVDLNISLIDNFRDILNIETQVHCSSHLIASGKKSTYLLDICSELGCNEYISPPGSSNYLDQAAQDFQNKDIEIKYFNYNHPVYSQPYQPFLPYMSILDLIFNEGPNSREIIDSGISD